MTDLVDLPALDERRDHHRPQHDPRCELVVHEVCARSGRRGREGRIRIVGWVGEQSDTGGRIRTWCVCVCVCVYVCVGGYGEREIKRERERDAAQHVMREACAG